MFLIDDDLHWSASDLTTAAECEYGVLRTLDLKLGRVDALAKAADPLREHIARLGDAHEAELLQALSEMKDVRSLPRAEAPYTAAGLAAVRQLTIDTLASGAALVHQAAFSDGEFLGYADFVERTDDGWVVCDAKLARSAKPTALLQLGAYADQLGRLGVLVAPTVALLLGNGERAEFQVADVLPVFAERRDRLRALLAEHRSVSGAAEWGDPRFVACGRCPECRAAAEATDDVILVAGLRMEQRRKLHGGGVTTLAELAAATTKPTGMGRGTFDKLRAQAAIQWKQRQADHGAPLEFELTGTAEETLVLLPAPSDGDLFFDFEGDPLYDEGDPSRVGLEYLWGVLDANGAYDATWAHDWAAEKAALAAFVDRVAAARLVHPDMHVYHYAPYETAALKRLAMRYQTREKELDDLLRSEVFVDLYATVRGAVRVGAASYSIKKLEPLYMGAELRSDEDDAVTDGGASVVAYHEYREMAGDAAAARLASLADYNRYDCLSTLRLRDWLLARAGDAGVRDQIVPREKVVTGEELSVADPLFVDLMARSGPARAAERTGEEQAFAMLATGLDYYRRERKQFWWEHFERLLHPVEDWADTRDVFVVEDAEVVEDWAVPDGKARNPRRSLRLRGRWAPGSKASAGAQLKAQVVYAAPQPPGVAGPDGAPYGSDDAFEITADPHDPEVVTLVESRKVGETFPQLPVALVPSSPPGTKDLEVALREMADAAAAAPSLPLTASLDLLARRSPRLRAGGALPIGAVPLEDVVAALVAMDDSYVAIQGPPGTGKTYTGSRVIKELVERHQWRIGVVAQSHFVVENMLGSIVKAGLDPALVGKNDNDTATPTWTVLKAGVPPRAAFLEEHRGTGCVLGGTAWTFANENLVERAGLDLLVVDEAGQFSLAPTIAAGISAQRLLLLGDPQQLPQVSQGTHLEPVNESALGWLMEGHDTIPDSLGYFLGRSYRMHPALCAKVSTLSYEGRLGSADEAARRDLAGVVPGLVVVEVDHAGNRTESPEEAAAVVAQVRSLMGTTWLDPEESAVPRPLAERDFVVVAPYNAQVSCIRATLDAAGFAAVRVGTVDKFQGQEAPVAIVSMTASSHGDVPRGMGFLLSRNRVNVAVSRAQWLAIVVRSSALTSFMPTSTQGVLELGAFIGLCTDRRTETHIEGERV